MNLIEGFGRGGKHTIHKTFHVAFDRSERRAQFVRDVSDELASHRLDLLKLHCHLIETRCELCDLVLTVYWHAFIVMPIGDALRCDTQRLKRRNNAAAQK